MTTKQKIANKEILIVLNKLNLINKIPKNIILSMQNNQDKDWNFVYDDNLRLDQQKLTRQSIIMFSNLYYMYICEDSKEKEKIKEICNENEKKANKETMEKLKNLSTNTSIAPPLEVEKSKIEKNKMVKAKKENFIRKLINKIKKFFKR